MNRSRSRFFPLATLLVTGLVGCGGGGDDSVFGPCTTSYLEPVFIITSVQNATTGASITTVMLNNVTLDGAPVPPGTPPISFNIRVVGSALECTAPCGFATQPGVYRFAVSANGFSVTTVQANGSYATFSGGCPSSYSGGSRLAITLTPT